MSIGLTILCLTNAITLIIISIAALRQRFAEQDEARATARFEKAYDDWYEQGMPSEYRPSK